MFTKTWFLIVAAINILFIGLMAKWLESIKNRAPIGYQDETGFHFGIKKS